MFNVIFRIFKFLFFRIIYCCISNKKKIGYICRYLNIFVDMYINVFKLIIIEKMYEISTSEFALEIHLQSRNFINVCNNYIHLLFFMFMFHVNTNLNLYLYVLYWYVVWRSIHFSLLFIFKKILYFYNEEEGKTTLLIFVFYAIYCWLKMLLFIINVHRQVAHSRNICL